MFLLLSTLSFMHDVGQIYPVLSTRHSCLDISIWTLDYVGKCFIYKFNPKSI